MNSCRRILLLAAIGAALVTVETTSAQAQGPGWGGWGWGNAYLYGNYRGGTYYPPYFSLYPPVYYSRPVPRTYGYSPFAYPPGTPTPEVFVEPVETQLMVNPHAPRNSSQAKPAPDQTTRKPQTVINPYVLGTEAAIAVQ